MSITLEENQQLLMNAIPHYEMWACPVRVFIP